MWSLWIIWRVRKNLLDTIFSTILHKNFELVTMVLISCFTSFLERNSDQISESSFRFGKQSETRAHIMLILIPTHTLIVHNPHTGAKTLIKKHRNNSCSVVKSCRGRTVMGYVFTFACRWDSWMLCKPVATGSSVSLDKTLLLPMKCCAQGV